jgi:hypothetical protein
LVFEAGVKKRLLRLKDAFPIVGTIVFRVLGGRAENAHGCGFGKGYHSGMSFADDFPRGFDFH